MMKRMDFGTNCRVTIICLSEAAGGSRGAHWRMGTASPPVSERASQNCLYSSADKRQAEQIPCDIDHQAEELFSQLVSQMAAAEGVTETLKASDQMEWVRRTNSIRNRAGEIVESELIYN